MPSSVKKDSYSKGKRSEEGSKFTLEM
jgi:hypothetical protein